VREDAVVMSCEAEFGASGSPVFTYNRGVPKIVSVVSAKAVQNGQRISLGMTLDDGQLQQVITDITRGNAYFETRSPGDGSISEQLGRGSGSSGLFRSVGN
jgi:protease YdgD